MKKAKKDRFGAGEASPRLRCAVCGCLTPLGEIRTGTVVRQPERGLLDICIDCYQEAPEGSIRLQKLRILS